MGFHNATVVYQYSGEFKTIIIERRLECSSLFNLPRLELPRNEAGSAVTLHCMKLSPRVNREINRKIDLRAIDIANLRGPF